MAFLVDLCLLDSVPFCLDFIMILGGSGVLSHGADCFMIFRVDKIWMFGTLSVYGLKVALHSLQLLKRACLYGCTCNDSNNTHTHTHTHTHILFPRAVPFLSLGSWPTFWLIALPLLVRFQ